MVQRPVEEDSLARWLEHAGTTALDVLTGEALDVIGVLDRDLRIRYVNWAGPGLTRAAAIGRNALDLTPPDYLDLARETYGKVLSTGVGATFETMYRDGEDVRMWEVRVGPIRDHGEIIGLIAITTNVTEQRRAHADRDRFFSLSLDMLVVASPTGHLKRANPAFGEALGYDLEELIGRPFVDLVHPDDREQTLAAFESVIARGGVYDIENRYRRRDGAHRVLSWRATADPVTRDVYAVARDVTDHRTMEAQLRHAQKMEAVGQLAGGVAHDFNNLMQAVLANAELALGRVSPSSEVAELLGEVQAAGKRAAALTRQLLAFSRRKPLRPVLVDVNALVGSIMKMLERLLPESIVVELLPGRGLARVSADPTQLEQVVVNLCVNARDAMERGGRLTIETADVVLRERAHGSRPWVKPGRYVRLRVTDTGSGMTPEVREHAFEPFFTTKSAHHGTGLGLSTVYGIVRQHDGTIDVESRPGEGTTFEIYLPAAGPVAADSQSAAVAAPRLGQETILLTEDEESVRRAVAHMLAQAGYRTIVAAGGFEAIRLLGESEAPVHLAILDVVMPDLGGPETWERLRELRPGLRAMFISGYADARHGERLPPDAAILEKPFQMEDLLRRVREVLDE